MGAIIYTAIFGGIDTLKYPVPQTEPCDFICFTDRETAGRVGPWRVINVRLRPNTHPRLQAKYFKLLSHRIFPGGRLAFHYAPLFWRRRADLSIWVDGTLEIKSPSFVTEMRKALANADWAMFRHPWRDCIYDEASASLELPKYQEMPIAEQAAAYRSAVPEHAGLYACGVIVRREPVSDRVAKANELWWKENLKWTPQDQLSLPYVLSKLPDAAPKSIQKDIFFNEWLDFTPHRTGNVI